MKQIHSKHLLRIVHIWCIAIMLTIAFPLSGRAASPDSLEPPVVSGSYQSERIRLTWEKVPKATSYKIYRTHSGKSYSYLTSTKKTSYTDREITGDLLYQYKIFAVYETEDTRVKSSGSKVCKVYSNRVDPSKKMIALTFDDGPGPYTKAIVDCLEKYDSAATFFIVGNRVSSYTTVMKALQNSDSELANHSYSHPNLTRLSVSSLKSELSKTDTALKTYSGVKPTLLRTPGGASNQTVRTYAKRPIIYWSVDTLDWKTRSTSKTVSSVLNNLGDGEIVLMHDIHEPTKNAALKLIPKLVSKGYQIVTVSELAKYHGYDLKDGTTYFSLPLKAPKLKKVTTSSDGSNYSATVSWSSQIGATYQIVYKVKGGTYQSAGTVKASQKTTSFTIERLKKQKSYTFSVRRYVTANDGKTYSDYASSITKKIS